MIVFVTVGRIFPRSSDRGDDGVNRRAVDLIAR
jgi:hypothetical protein